MSPSFVETACLDGVFTIRLAQAPVNVLHAPMMATIGAALDEAAPRRIGWAWATGSSTASTSMRR